jgi:Uma2 family endonuclease
MANTQTRLLTFAEFEQLPDPPEGRFELHDGELVLVPPPNPTHFFTQQKLRKLLQRAAGEAGEAYTEAPFRPTPERSFFQVDVAYSSRERWAQVAPGGYPPVPELVIEVWSPSNRAGETAHKRKTCLANGAQQFWEVRGDRRTVEVSTPDGGSVTYSAGQHIPLFFAPGQTIAVDEIFV